MCQINPPLAHQIYFELPHDALTIFCNHRPELGIHFTSNPTCYLLHRSLLRRTIARLLDQYAQLHRTMSLGLVHFLMFRFSF